MHFNRSLNSCVAREMFAPPVARANDHKHVMFCVLLFSNDQLFCKCFAY